MKPFLISLTKAVLGLAVNASIDFSSGTLNLKGMTMSRTSLYHWFTHCLSRTILSTCWVSSCHSSLKTKQMRSEPSPGGPRLLWDNRLVVFEWKPKSHLSCKASYSYFSFCLGYTHSRSVSSLDYSHAGWRCSKLFMMNWHENWHQHPGQFGDFSFPQYSRSYIPLDSVVHYTLVLINEGQHALIKVFCEIYSCVSGALFSCFSF